MFSLDCGLILVAAGLLLFAALLDIGFRMIPDWLSVAILGDGIVLRLMDHHLAAGLACGGAIFVLAVVCWRPGWLGGGDVKLLAASAVLVPPPLVPGFILTVALAGGVLAILYLVLERIMPSPRLRHKASLLYRLLTVECRRIHRRTSLPYATAISAAALLVLIKG